MATLSTTGITGLVALSGYDGMIYATGWLVGLGLLTCSNPTEPVARSIEEFDLRLESLRQQSHIPALSVAIAQNQRIAWSQG